jgi:hypothetical protein
MNERRNEPRTWTVPEPDGPRSEERIDGGFVLVNGWQVRYQPTAEHRASIAKSVVTGPNRKARRAAFKTEARAIKRERRHDLQLSPLAYEVGEARRALRNAMKRERRAGR